MGKALLLAFAILAGAVPARAWNTTKHCEKHHKTCHTHKTCHHHRQICHHRPNPNPSAHCPA